MIEPAVETQKPLELHLEEKLPPSDVEANKRFIEEYYRYILKKFAAYPGDNTREK